MASPDKKKLQQRYIHDESIPLKKRADYAAATAFDKVVVPSSIGMAVVSGILSVTFHLSNGQGITAVEEQVKALPLEIHDLGERLTNLYMAAGTRTYEALELERAAKRLLSLDGDDIRRSTFIFPKQGNMVTFSGPDQPAPVTREVSPAGLSKTFAANLTEYKGKLETGQAYTSGFAGLLTLAMGIWAFGNWRMSKRREDIPARHYGQS